MSAVSEFHLHDQVRLRLPHDGLRPGAAGRVLGWPERERRSYFISFDERTPTKVPAEALEPHAAPDSAAG
jgi:hypothetical protein